MTTAHRATWKAARGGLQEEGSFRLHVGSAMTSAKDAPTERKLKIRQGEKVSRHDLKKLLEKEEGGEEKEIGEMKRLGIGEEVRGEENEIEREEVESEDEGSDDESEDEAELLAELERIKKEREYEKVKMKEKEQEREMIDNPLLGRESLYGDEMSESVSVATASVNGFKVKRRWDEDVVFQNQSRNRNNEGQGDDVDERKQKKARFINDTIRNDYHRRFMKRFMR